MMNEYMFIYEGGDKNWFETATPEEIKTVMGQWGAWFQQLEASGHLRNPGAPLGPGGAIVSRNGSGIKTDTALPEVKELIGGYSIVAANSLEEAVKLAQGSPHLNDRVPATVVIRPVIQV
ncbi:MAG: hypothetical protein KDC35_19805 [Acidobacteria bacterium]|nr:hypothetical protein [Acidobacteriota bacterium]